MTETMKVKVRTPKDVPERKQSEEFAKRKLPQSELLDTGWEVLLVPYGGPILGRDSYGEAFTDKSDIGLLVGDSVIATYYHGFGPDDPDDWQEHPAIIGSLIYARADERGHWFDVYLDESEPLAQRLLEAELDNLRASSGAAGHLVRYDRGGIIRNWWVAEGALFDTNEWRQPANDYAVIVAKATDDKNTKAAAQAGEATPAAVGTVEEAKLSTIKAIVPSEETMEDVITVVEETKNQELEAVKAAQAKQAEELEALKRELPGIRKSVEQAKETPKEVSDKAEVAEFVKALRTGIAAKASVAETMTTTNSPQFLVPKCTYEKILALARKMSLLERLNIQRIPGPKVVKGGEFSEFVVTNEAATTDLDRLVNGAVIDVPLVKYTKRVEITWELLEASDDAVEDYVINAVARALARTQSNLVSALVKTGTTKLATFAAAAAFSAGDIEKMLYSSAIGDVIDETGDVKFLTSRPNYGLLASITGSNRFYGDTGIDQTQQPIRENLLGYPVLFDASIPAPVAAGKTVYLGNWNRALGIREGTSLEFIRDPYSRASNGILALHFYYMAGLVVLDQTAFGYGQHP